MSFSGIILTIVMNKIMCWCLMNKYVLVWERNFWESMMENGTYQKTQLPFRFWHWENIKKKKMYHGSTKRVSLFWTHQGTFRIQTVRRWRDKELGVDTPCLNGSSSTASLSLSTSLFIFFLSITFKFLGLLHFLSQKNK